MTVDLLDPRFLANPHEVFDDLRRNCPVASTSIDDGALILTRYADIEHVARNPILFSSASVTVAKNRARKSDSEFSNLPLSPLTSDPPLHREDRRRVRPHLLPGGLGADFLVHAERVVRQQAETLTETGECDVVRDFAVPVAVRTIGIILGFPEETVSFAADVARIIEPRTDEVDTTSRGDRMMQQVARVLGDESTDELRDGILRDMARKGNVPQRTVLGIAKLLLVAGIDSTSATIVNCLLELLDFDPQLRHEVADSLSLEQSPALEELLRLASPTTMARVATRETVVADVKIAAGSRILLPFAAANRDPEVFSDPHEFRISGRGTSHVAFGIGIHNCAGAYVARAVVQRALATWLAFFPGFQARHESLEWRGGQVRTPRALPVVLKPEVG